MQIKTELTYDLSQSDIRAAIIAYVNTKHDAQAKDGDLQLTINRGYSGMGSIGEDDIPPSVHARVVVETKSEPAQPGGGGIRVRV